MSALSEPEEPRAALNLPSRLHIRSCSASSVTDCDDEGAMRQQAPGTPTAGGSRRSDSRSSFPPPPSLCQGHHELLEAVRAWTQQTAAAAAGLRCSGSTTRRSSHQLQGTPLSRRLTAGGAT